METTNKNIRQLLEMLDNPDAYTEQQIRDIINHDEDTRETYRLMVEAKRSSRHRQNKELVNVDAAWQRFNQKFQPKQSSSNWMKIAASFIGVLIPLEKMLPEIAAHYDVKVVFANDEARGLRFHFVWNPQKGIGQIISDLNQFERLSATLKDNQITVE